MNGTFLQSLLAKQINVGGIQSIVARVQSKDGQVNLAAAAGIANPETGNVMTVDTPYFIASISKTYTAAMIIRLHEQGRLDLDKQITEYLPATILDGIHTYKGHDYSREMKVYQLVSQTSGLPDYFEGKPKGKRSMYEEIKQGGADRSCTTEEVIAIARGLTPLFEPDAKNGKKAHYADTNYHLLGAIIEAVTGKSYAENLAQMIEPLKLQHTYAFDTNQTQLRQKPAMIYFKGRALDVPLFMSTHLAEGGIVSTASENITFMRALFDGKLFDPKHMERMTRQWNSIFFPIQYGYGLMRFKLPRIFSPFQATPEFIGHSGSTGSFAFYSPDRQLYFAGTVNQSNLPSKPFQLMLQIASGIKELG